MVCVGAVEGLRADLPIGTNALSATASDPGPERRTTAKPPSPSAVAIAAMVSSNMRSVAAPDLGLRGEGSERSGANSGSIRRAGNFLGCWPPPVPGGKGAPSGNSAAGDNGGGSDRSVGATGASDRRGGKRAAGGWVSDLLRGWIAPCALIRADIPKWLFPVRSCFTHSAKHRWDQVHFHPATGAAPGRADFPATARLASD